MKNYFEKLTKAWQTFKESPVYRLLKNENGYVRIYRRDNNQLVLDIQNEDAYAEIINFVGDGIVQSSRTIEVVIPTEEGLKEYIGPYPYNEFRPEGVVEFVRIKA